MAAISYTKIPRVSFTNVIQHLRNNFFADEPLNKSVELCRPGESHAELEDFSLQILQDELSFMAVLPSTREVIGVVLNGMYHPKDESEKKPYNDQKLELIFDFLEKNGSQSMSDGLAGNQVFEVKILSVDDRFRGRGIASKLFEMSENLAKQRGFQVTPPPYLFQMMRADATALFSQKLFEKFGFQTVREVMYNEYPNKDTPHFKVESPHVSFKVMVKNLL